MNKRKILFIIPSLVGGGAERVLINLLNRFDYNIYDIDLCVVVNKGVYFSEIPSQVNVTTIFKNQILANILVKLHVILNINFLYRIIVKKAIKGRYHIGISFIDSSFTDILFFLKKEQIQKRIAWVHSSYYSYSNYRRYYKGKYKDRILSCRYGKLDHIVFVSNDSLYEFVEIFGKPTEMSTIYNLIDKNGILRKANEPLFFPFDNSIVNIVAVGSLYPVKGYDKLIESTKKLKDEGLKFKIWILGDGPLKNTLFDLISKFDISDFVTLCGFKSNPYPFMKASDIFIMTSLSEALPTALCEAMILGLPTIVTNCSGCREIVDNGKYGLMVNRSVSCICDGLRKMIVSEEIRKNFKLKSLNRSEIFNDDSVLEKVYSLMDCDNEKSDENILY